MPGSTGENRYCPSPFVAPGIGEPSGWHDRETDAPATTLPCGSVTRPVTAAVPGVCGHTGRAKSTNPKITAARIDPILRPFPLQAVRCAFTSCDVRLFCAVMIINTEKNPRKISPRPSGPAHKVPRLKEQPSRLLVHA